MTKFEENTGTDFPETRKKRDWTPLFIILVLVLIGIIVFFYLQTKNLKETEAQQTKALSEALLQIDSISNELDQRILKITQLGGEVDTLLQVREQLEAEKKALLTDQSNQKKAITALRDKVGGYQELLLAKDEEINRLQTLNKELMSENVELKTEKQQLNQSIQQITKAREELEQKVAEAARLKVEGMKISAVNENGREREGEFRNRHIDKLKITFTVAENKVAPIEGKELLLRIVGPDGNVIFDVTRGSGSFIFEQREMFYSVKQEILYDKNNQKVTVFYDKGSEYAEGKYEVEVYTDEYLMGKGSFVVK